MHGFHPQSGHFFKFYRNTGSFATPVWGLISEIGDLSLDDLTMGVAELKRRANGFTKALPTLMQLASLSFRLHFGLGATIYSALRVDFLAGTVREYAIVSGDIAAPSGAEGWRLPLLLTAFPFDQGHENVAGHDVKANLGYLVSGGTEVDMTWLVVTSTTSV